MEQTARLFIIITRASALIKKGRCSERQREENGIDECALAAGARRVSAGVLLLIKPAGLRARAATKAFLFLPAHEGGRE